MWESRRDFQRVWEGWEAGFMAFHAFHTLSFPWPAFADADHRKSKLPQCMVRRLNAREKLVDEESLRQCIRPVVWRCLSWP